MTRGLISEEIINEIRSKHDLVRMVAKYAGPLVLVGDNFQCWCPFHVSDSRSFTVIPRYQVFYCYDCGVGGNVFSFITRITGMTFSETLRHLGRMAGIKVPD